MKILQYLHTQDVFSFVAVLAHSRITHCPVSGGVAESELCNGPSCPICSAVSARGVTDTVRWKGRGVSRQPIRTLYLGHVTGYQPIREQYFLIWSVPSTLDRERS